MIVSEVALEMLIYEVLLFSWTSPESRNAAEAGCGGQIVSTQQADAFRDEGRPDCIPGADGPGGGLPVASQDASTVGLADLAAQDLELGVVEGGAVDLADVGQEAGRGDRGHGGGDVGLGGVQEVQVRIVEEVALAHRLDLVERRVARADDSDGTQRDARAVEGCQVSSGAQGFQGLDHDGPRGGAVGLDVDEQQDRLVRGGIVDAMLRRRSHERRGRVLASQDIEDRLHVQRGEGALLSQGGGFVADIQRVVEQPDVGFERRAAHGQGRIEGDIPPVVVVRVDWFL